MSRQIPVSDKVVFKLGPTEKIAFQINASGNVEIKDASGNIIGTLDAANCKLAFLGKLTGALVCDAQNLSTDTTTGTKIGTGATQKLGFWNATPVVQQAHIVDADGTLADITTKFNNLLLKLETEGLLASA